MSGEGQKEITLESKQEEMPEEEADNELEHALNNRNRADNTAFRWTITRAEIMEKRMIKEGKSSEKEIRNICSLICKIHPLHERQIQRYFDYPDENGKQSYKKYKRRHEKYELTRPTHVGIMRETDLKIQDVKEFLEKLLVDDIGEYGKDNFHDITDLIHKVADHAVSEFKRNNLEYISPINKAKSGIKSIKDKENNRISLEEASQPKDEKILTAKKYLHEEIHGLANDLIQMDNDLDKWISDDPETIDGFIRGVQSLRLLVKPINSNKHTADACKQMDYLEEWLNRNNNAIYGEYHTRDPKYKIDINTGKPFALKGENSTIPTTEAGLRQMNELGFIVKSFAFLPAMFRNYRESKYKMKLKRKLDMHEKLSEAA